MPEHQQLDIACQWKGYSLGANMMRFEQVPVLMRRAMSRRFKNCNKGQFLVVYTVVEPRCSG